MIIRTAALSGALWRAVTINELGLRDLDPITNDAMVAQVLRWADRSKTGTSGAIVVCARLGLSLTDARRRANGSKL